MRLKFLSVALGATLVTGLSTAPPSQASEPTPPTPFIIGGSTVPDGAALWSAQVNVGGGFCSGSVIGPVWVLTAAHCGRGGSVRVGSQRLGQGRAIGVVQDFTNGDMALKRLASSANLSQYLPWSATAPPMGAAVQIYGWGGISAPGGPLAQSLKTANVRVVGIGSTIDGAPINGQAYFGDSGGPMVHNGQVIGTCTGPVGGGTDPSQLTVAYQSAPRRAAWIQQTTGIPPGGGGNPNPPPPPGPQPPPPPPAPPPPPGPGVGAWQPYTSYAVGARVTYGGLAYRAVQAHTSLPGWEPPNVPALWQPA